MLQLRKPEYQPDDCKKIFLTEDIFALLDNDDYESIRRYTWKLEQSGHCFYAVRRDKTGGKCLTFKMHREIMHTPFGYEVHHINHNTLDNRKSNLENLTADEHRAAHFKST